jgi:hypothetical protein
VRPVREIHTDIERLSERRTDLWHQLSELHDPSVRAELKEIDEQLNALWDEERAAKAELRFGTRERIVQRARAEERLERAA